MARWRAPATTQASASPSAVLLSALSSLPTLADEADTYQVNKILMSNPYLWSSLIEYELMFCCECGIQCHCNLSYPSMWMQISQVLTRRPVACAWGVA